MRLLSILGVLACVGLVSATPPCHVQQIQAVQAVQYATPVLPLYTIGYQAPVDLTPLLEELRAMRLEMQQLRAGGGVLPLEEPAGLKVLRESCGRCHTGPDAKKGFQVFDAKGTLVGDAGKIVSAIDAGTMPPPPAKLSFEAKYNALKHLTVQPVAAGK